MAHRLEKSDEACLNAIRILYQHATRHPLPFSRPILKLGFDGQQAHETDAEPAPETSVWVDIEGLLFAID